MDIRTLDQSDIGVTVLIHEIMQEAYKQEAQMLGVKRFPPLERSADEIASENGIFYGLFREGALAGVLHFNQGNIDTLVVKPAYQGHGIASRLMDRLLSAVGNDMITVSTAEANTRAVSLYEKFGFGQESLEQKSGIPIVNFVRSPRS